MTTADSNALTEASPKQVQTFPHVHEATSVGSTQCPVFLSLRLFLNLSGALPPFAEKVCPRGKFFEIAENLFIQSYLWLWLIKNSRLAIIPSQNLNALLCGLPGKLMPFWCLFICMLYVFPLWKTVVSSLYSSGPLPFWHQGLVSRKTIFHGLLRAVVLRWFKHVVFSVHFISTIPQAAPQIIMY